jgi:hypothetical protein
MKYLNLIIPLVVINAMTAVTSPAQDNAPFTITPVPAPIPGVKDVGGVEGGQAPLGYVEIQGLSAGPFDPKLWEENKLHWMPDVRMPLLAPRMGGVFRNIYAPSAIEEGEGWRFFYAAWDGIESGTDRVYSATTPDFIDFYDRHTVINNGEFVHVCNVNVQKLEDGSLQMYATAWPDTARRNWPVYFHSKDGKIWNGSTEPYHAKKTDAVSILGYPAEGRADLNGANVLLYDKGKYTLYFTNWRDRGKLYWAEGKTPAVVKFGGLSLETEHAVNDVKKFTVGGKDWYLMALHKKGDVGLSQKDVDKTFFSLSNDGHNFGKESLMVPARCEMDRNIFAVGLVTRKDRILGVLYGAGPSIRSNRNQIFGYWLQKRVLLTANRAGRGAEYEAEAAFGPDRQLIKLPPVLPPLGDDPGVVNFEGTISIFAEDGVTPLGTQQVVLKPGIVYKVVWK